MRNLAFLALPLALAACSPAADGDAANDIDPAAEQTADSAGETAGEGVLDLQATGIIVPAQGGFEELSVPFGSMRVATEATLASILGEPTGTTEGGDDCAYPSTQYEGMTLVFEEDAFVGYMARAPYVPQLSRAEMLEDSMVEMQEGSTLGQEFIIGSPDGPMISGLFSGEGDNAIVETLWAGTNCIFR
ncbi:hypothetical protein GRI62_07510 [Erythrobacter arachoides]|uniref:Aspartate-semialdehyde dehydrogenase n=1 Tax=Aurantiacibacter arachoides TaxID=1850444 RepID=A0A845A1X7_9SPHN|nr:hypothetical protein [Aurantiacibacter arachoides]MXO93452.1 hypothetical protein [Aurantiacibacter arachoides]GGD49272.1 hypothetical protein GCM10011411_06300 [Aurantiacibacter arachoides]